MRLKQVRKLCPDLIQCSADPQRYVQVTTSIMQALESLSLNMNIFSVGEAFPLQKRIWRDVVIVMI